MEKEVPPPESMVTIKPDYAPSEMYSTSEAPPAYHNPRPASVQITKMISMTVILVSLILGGCILAASYINANASCRHLEEELQLLTESMAYDPVVPAAPAVPNKPEALVQEPEALKDQKSEESKQPSNTKVDIEIDENSSGSSSSSSSEESNSDSDSSDDEDAGTTSNLSSQIPIHIRLPIQFDEILNSLDRKEGKNKMNCVVEKKHADRIIEHKAKTIPLPFGVNLTSDPGLERVSGERITIVCESGSHTKALEENNDINDEDDEQLVMIQPVMVPLPAAQFNTHMPMRQMPPPRENFNYNPQPRREYIHPMEQMRPPLPPARSENDIPNPILHHIAQQIIAAKLREEAEANNRMPMQGTTPLQRINPMPSNALPESQRFNPGRLPIPEEVLNQINRMSGNKDGNNVLIVSEESGSGDDTGSSDNDQMDQIQSIGLRLIQQQRDSAQVPGGRQAFARGMMSGGPMQAPMGMQMLPVDIPVTMMEKMASPDMPAQEGREERQEDEGQRPDFVQPR